MMRILLSLFILLCLSCGATRRVSKQSSTKDPILVIKQKGGMSGEVYKAVFFNDNRYTFYTRRDTTTMEMTPDQTKAISDGVSRLSSTTMQTYDSEVVDMPWRTYMTAGGDILAKSRGEAVPLLSTADEILDESIQSSLEVKSSIMPGEWLVYLNGTITWQEVEKEVNVTPPKEVKKISSLGNVWLIKIDPDTEEDYVRQVRKSSDVRAVEPNRKMTLRDR